jgi:hypothetical protein
VTCAVFLRERSVFRIVHGEPHLGMVVVEDRNPRDGNRHHRGRDELRFLGKPGNDVDSLAVERRHQGADPLTVLPDAELDTASSSAVASPSDTTTFVRNPRIRATAMSRTRSS